jgi:hypothetical protein
MLDGKDLLSTGIALSFQENQFEEKVFGASSKALWFQSSIPSKGSFRNRAPNQFGNQAINVIN